MITTETLETTVTVETESHEGARQVASDNWKNGNCTLNTDHFKDVIFRIEDQDRDRDE